MERTGLEPSKKVAFCEYDFDKQGGAIGTLTLLGARLPDDAIVTGGMIHVKKAITSAGAPSVALGLEAGGDVLAATLKAALVLNALLDVIPDGTAAHAIRTTAAGKGVSMTIAADAITGGRFIVALEYY